MNNIETRFSIRVDKLAIVILIVFGLVSTLLLAWSDTQAELDYYISAEEEAEAFPFLYEEDTVESQVSPYLVQAQLYDAPRSQVERVLDTMIGVGVNDKNGDGMIDCIDYSIQFRQWYGPDAKLYINKNPENGMNHMFIRIIKGNKILDVEPQGTPDRYTMGLVWGVQYDPRYNQDVTSIWSPDITGDF